MKKQRVMHNLPIGYTQGKLTVVSEAYSVRKFSKSSFRCVGCLCVCGNVVQVSLSRLGSGKTKSCGCLSKELVSRKRLSDEDRVRNSLIQEYKNSASQRKLTYDLDDETLFTLIKSNCHYCGKSSYKPHRKCDNFLYNGLDRIENSVGYVESNVVPCCFICNKMKGVLSKEEFMEHLDKIWTRIA